MHAPAAAGTEKALMQASAEYDKRSSSGRLAQFSQVCHPTSSGSQRHDMQVAPLTTALCAAHSACEAAQQPCGGGRPQQLQHHKAGCRQQQRCVLGVRWTLTGRSSTDADAQRCDRGG